MIKKHKKKCITIFILILSVIILNGIELLLAGEQIELRTFVQVGKGIYVWLIVPGVCAWLIHQICKELCEQKKWMRVVRNILLVIAFIIILIVSVCRGFVYVLSTQCKDEKVLEDGILEIKESDWDNTRTYYNESVLFFFRKPFPGYSKEEVISKITERYPGEVTFESMEGELYRFSGKIQTPEKGTFSFLVKNDYPLTNDYEETLVKFLTDSFFEKKMRNCSYIESKMDVRTKYLPVVDCYGRSDLESFCEDVAELMEFYLENETLRENVKAIHSIGVSLNQEYRAFYVGSYLTDFDKTKLYNYLYEEMEKWIDDQYSKSVLAVEEASDEETEKNTFEVTPEIIEYYLSIEPACTFVTKEGLEYRVIATDRACGSSYFSMITTLDGGKTCQDVVPDPFNGSGGEANWITFVDNQVGFVGMSYSGGSLGMLFRTADGGKTFQYLEYPSPMIELPDGTYYNPFIMPKRIYEKEGILYMEAGQGPDGDYKGGDDRCIGIYQSKDMGITWKFVKEEMTEATEEG